MIDLDNLERLEREATPGEWRVADDGSGFMAVLAGDRVIADMGCIGPHAPDPDLIASARNALPALLAVARAAVAWEEAAGVSVPPRFSRQSEEQTRRDALLAAVRALKEAP